MNNYLKSIRIMTFNILYDSGENHPYPWRIRKELIISMIQFYDPDIFCLQEPLQHQVNEFIEHFPDHNYLSIGCRDGVQGGEHMTIFYSNNKFNLLDSGKIGLSEMPERAGVIGWDASNPRLAIWVKLMHNITKKVVFIINTHFDHIGENARQQSALLICEKMKDLTESHPVLFCGDFNANENSIPYKNILVCGFTDCASVSGIVNINTPYTFHGFLANKSPEEIIKYKNDKRLLNIIDHIFFKGSISILRHEILTDSYNGIYPSDHFPKICDLLLI